MKELKIMEKDNFVYRLEDESGQVYTLNLEFFDIEEKPEVGYCIWMRDELLDSKYEGYSVSYTFGNLENRYGKENISLDDVDVIRYVFENKEIYLKRLYG